MTFQYLSQLRSDLKKNPSYEKLQAIARWFGVGADYFAAAEVARRIDEEFRALEFMRDPGERRVAFMAKEVGPDSLKLVVGMLDLMRKAEGLPSVLDGRGEE